MDDHRHACTAVRDAISARLDNESVDLTDHTVEAHLGTCQACRSYRDGAAALHPSIRLAPAGPVPDLRAEILAAIPDPTPQRRHHERRRRQGRAVLGLAGAVQALLAALTLVGTTTLHVAHEVAAFELAIGGVMLLAAARPRRFADGLLPVLAVTAGIVGWSAVVDIARGLAGPVQEFPHLLPALGALVLWRFIPRTPRPDHGMAVPA